MARAGRGLLGALAALGGLGAGAAAQEPGIYLGPGPQPQFPLPRGEVPVLTLDRDRLFAASAFGGRVARELQAASEVLAAENRRIEADLTAEERALTERRAGMDAEAFGPLADAFDARVEVLRRAQDAKARALQAREEAERQAFVQAVLPVLADLVAELGASVILDERAVFLSADAIDVTDRAIARVDAEIGDGANLAPAVPAPPRSPDPDQAPEPGGVDLLPAEPRAPGEE